jgi:hypothetical protein
MAPLLLLFFFRLPRRQQVILVALAVVVCAAWMIPSEIARRRYYPDTPQAMLGRVATGAILMGKINRYTVSNALRFFLPLAVALGPSAVYMFRRRDAIALWLWVWVLPGSLFFLMLFISDAPYLDCLLGGFILLCLTGMAQSQSRRVAVAVLTCSILINVFFYVGFRPRPPRNNLYAIAEKDLGDYTLYGVKHQYFVPRLTLKP